MTSRLAIALFGFALSLAATAQDLPVLATAPPASQDAWIEQLLALGGSDSSRDGAPASVVPIWSGTDGHLLAIVAVPGQWGSPLLAGTTGEVGPTRWLLLGGADVDTGGLRWQSASGFHTDVLFSSVQPTLPLAPCGASCATSDALGAFAGSLGLGWMSPEGALDLSYGLSWLQTRDSTPPGLEAIPLAGAGVPVLTLPNLLTSGLQSSTSMFAQGRWHFADSAAIDIGASYGHGRTSTLGATGTTLPGIDLDQLSLSLGLDAGSLRGAIVGHVLRSDDPTLIGRKWTTLDLGVSWRTPWRAEISVGAQNLWSAPMDATRDSDPAQARTPYIQYRQDL